MIVSDSLLDNEKDIIDKKLIPDIEELVKKVDNILDANGMHDDISVIKNTIHKEFSYLGDIYYVLYISGNFHNDTLYLKASQLVGEKILRKFENMDTITKIDKAFMKVDPNEEILQKLSIIENMDNKIKDLSLFELIKTVKCYNAEVNESEDSFTVDFKYNNFLEYNDAIKKVNECKESLKSIFENHKITTAYSKVIIDKAITEAQAHELSIKEDNQDIIDLLKCALCEEFNAWYQYFIVYPFVKGPKRHQVEDFYKDTAKDELDDHAVSILERLNVLGADKEIIDINIVDAWNQFAEHKYIVPVNDFDTVKSIQQNIDAEKGAIETYTKLVEISEGRDIVTCELAKHILADEQEHLQDLEEILEEAKA